MSDSYTSTDDDSRGYGGPDGFGITAGLCPICGRPVLKIGIGQHGSFTSHKAEGLFLEQSSLNAWFHECESGNDRT